MRKLMTIVSLIALLFGCSSQRAAHSLIKNKESVPKDLNSPQYVLLVLKLNEPEWAALNKGLVKDLAKHKYPVIAVSEEDLASGKYDDTNKYRYLLRAYDHTLVRTTTTYQRPASGVSVNVPLRKSTDVFFEFYFRDRKEKHDLPSTGYQSTYRTGIHYVLAYQN